ncbi:MAG: tetratricopeptide repeat protein [Pirellulaceae bacterium]
MHSPKLIWRLMFASMLAAQGVLAQAPAADPYAVSFNDFDWVDPIELEPLAGSVPIGEPLNTVAAIELFENKVAAQPDDFASRTVLGELLLRRAKNDDHLPSYSLSQKSLEAALAINPQYLPAKLALASAYMAQHEFKAALRLLEEMDQQYPSRPATLAGLVDCQIELGDYASAKALLERLLKLERSAPVLARAARIEELEGKCLQAISLMDEAIVDLRNTTDATDACLAWYRWRKGTLLLKNGQTDQARDAFQSVLSANPHAEASLVGLAMAHFADNNLPAAIQSLEVAAESDAPPVLALLGDALAIAGNAERAQQLWQETEAVMREEAKVAKVAHAREVAMFYADHDRNLGEALELSDIDFTQRADTYAWDCRAWALFKNGQAREAKIASEKALAAMPYDLNLLFHAALIEEHVGNIQTAREYALRISEVNPRFSITYYNDFNELQQRLNY